MLQDAVNGVQLRRQEKGLPLLNEVELNEFVANIQENIDHSDAKRSVREHDADLIFENRQDRLDTVRKQADKYNIKFCYNRNMDLQRIELDRVRGGNNIEIVTFEDRLVKSTFGGSTTAWMNAVEESTNKPLRIYATAFCGEFKLRDKGGNIVCYPNTNDPIIIRDKFDKLVGMEESLAKFLMGDTITSEVPESSLGYARQELMAREYKLTFPK